MSSRTGKWMIAAGALMILAGLCFIPAAFGDHPEADVWGMGIGLFSLGAMTVAAGTYLNARLLHAAIEATGLAKELKRGRGGCELCGNESPIIQCKIHQLHLCGNCQAEHYDLRSCLYVPSNRRVASKGKAMAKVRGA